MASAKDTFEPNTFEANSFACETWRGIGAVVVLVIAGGQLRIPPNRPGQRIPTNKPGQVIPRNDDL